MGACTGAVVVVVIIIVGEMAGVTVSGHAAGSAAMQDEAVQIPNWVANHEARDSTVRVVAVAV
jgi:hypothetical protein